MRQPTPYESEVEALYRATLDDLEWEVLGELWRLAETDARLEAALCRACEVSYAECIAAETN